MRRSLLVLSAAALFVFGANTSSSAGAASAAVDAPVPVPQGLARATVAALAAEPVDTAEHSGGRTDAPPATRSSALTTNVKTTTREPLAARPALASAKLISSSRDACVMSLPISGDPDGFLASARRVLGSKGGTVSGTTTAGSFSVPAPLGRVEGSYAMEAGAARLTLTPASLGFVQSCPAVYAALTSALHR